MNQDELKDYYDVIIIGSGISGMVCANYLAKKSSLSVLLLEKNEHPGGFTSGFYRSGYYFNAGSLCISLPDYFIDLLNDIKPGLGNDIGIDHYTIHFKNDFIGFDNFRKVPESVSSIYPELKNQLYKFFSILGGGIDFIESFMKCINFFKWFDRGFLYKIYCIIKTIPAVIRHLPYIILYSVKNINGILLKIFGQITENPAYFFSTMNGYDNMKMIPYLIMCNESLKGFGYPKNGFLDLSHKLISEFVKNGGTYKNKCNADKIIIKNGKCAGITAGKKTIASKHVITGIDLKKTVFELAGKSGYPKNFIDRLKEAEPSESVLIMYIGIKNNNSGRFKSLSDKYVIYVPENFKGEKDIESYIEKSYMVSSPFFSSSDKNNGDKKSIIIHIPLLYGVNADWKGLSQSEYKNLKNKLISKVISRLESHMPGLKESIETAELATPITIEKWIGNTGGATSGFSWDQTKSFLKTNSFTKYFIKTPVKNLHHIGAFSTVNGGVFMSAVTGKIIAEKLKKEKPGKKHLHHMQAFL